MTNFFPNTVKNLNPTLWNCDSLAEHIDDPIVKVIAKWRHQPSILPIPPEYKNWANFYFNFVSKEDVLTEIKVLNVSKAIQESDIPFKIIKVN